MSTQAPQKEIWQDQAVIGRAKAIGESFAGIVLDTAQAVAAVAAPTGDEAARAALVATLFRAHGLVDVVQDDLHDVVARALGQNHATAVLLAGHIDTVFARETPIRLWADEQRAYGPGLGDNSLGIAAVIHVNNMIRELGVPLETDLLLTGNVGEEGLGNLRGAKQVLDDYPEIGAMLAVEGQNLGRITHIAVGSRRLRVTVTGPGGHSWGDFGNPSAIHAAAKLIDALERIPLTQSPKTTLNVGMISGGISINSIAPEVTFDIDARSTDPAALRRVVDRIRAALSSRDDRIQVKTDVLGDRPAGQVPPSSRIVTSAAEILQTLGCQASADASSTDANAAIARGIPAICIGMTTGANAHRLEEYIDVGPIATGLSQLLLLTVSLARDLNAGRLTTRQ
jgi:tripeptide aminopeptidase